MQYCDGFRDWHKCFRCEDSCTVRCPLEAGAMDDPSVRVHFMQREIVLKDKKGRLYRDDIKES